MRACVHACMRECVCVCGTADTGQPVRRSDLTLVERAASILYRIACRVAHQPPQHKTLQRGAPCCNALRRVATLARGWLLQASPGRSSGIATQHAAADSCRPERSPAHLQRLHAVLEQHLVLRRRQPLASGAPSLELDLQRQHSHAAVRARSAKARVDECAPMRARPRRAARPAHAAAWARG